MKSHKELSDDEIKAVVANVLSTDKTISDPAFNLLADYIGDCIGMICNKYSKMTRVDCKDDLKQCCLMALREACDVYDKIRPFKPLGNVIMLRRAATYLKRVNRKSDRQNTKAVYMSNLGHEDEGDPLHSHITSVPRDVDLTQLKRLLPKLSEGERKLLQSMAGVAGSSYRVDYPAIAEEYERRYQEPISIKRVDNAVQRIRGKARRLADYEANLSKEKKGTATV